MKAQRTFIGDKNIKCSMRRSKILIKSFFTKAKHVAHVARYRAGDCAGSAGIVNVNSGS